MARFFGPSFRSRSELRLDNGAPALYDTFVIDVERRCPQYDPLGAIKLTSTGSRRRGVDEPKANDIELRSLRRFVSRRASRS